MRTLIPSSLSGRLLANFATEDIYKALQTRRYAVSSTIDAALQWLPDHPCPPLQAGPTSTNYWNQINSPFSTSYPRTRLRSHQSYKEPKLPVSVSHPAAKKKNQTPPSPRPLDQTENVPSHHPSSYQQSLHPLANPKSLSHSKVNDSFPQSSTENPSNLPCKRPSLRTEF